MKRTFIMFFLMFSVAIFTSCDSPRVMDDNTLIENRINSFVKAYNSGDYDDVLECFSEKTRNTYKSAISISESIGDMFGIGLKASDLFGLGVGIMSEEDMLTVKTVNIETEDDSHAVAEVCIAYNDINSEGGNQAMIFSMIKEDNAWFIDDIN